ncbi:uncharacterized protein LOC112689991 isoform X1 [Sipha flava]|uniref:Uncharacterized protein LOC112689991 isoform X1 n=1 Tax=Sipha flava TaxID=143950 RepID=A0A2S2PVV7_9HEMI|nr:uncharacterized protein LOC112689991 isoform X1 [Sipha flava]
MDPTKRDLKRKNTTLPYCTKTPRLQADNLSQNGLFSDWPMHCRFPLFNQDLQPEPVNLHSNSSGSHHRRPEPSRALDIAVERAHDRLRPVNPLHHQDDREHNRHHA